MELFLPVLTAKVVYCTTKQYTCEDFIYQTIIPITVCVFNEYLIFTSKLDK